MQIKLAGALKKYAKNAKVKTFEQMRAGFENYLGNRIFKRGNFPFPHTTKI